MPEVGDGVVEGVFVGEDDVEGHLLLVRFWWWWRRGLGGHFEVRRVRFVG